MAQLKDTVIQGSLNVTNAITTDDLYTTGLRHHTITGTGTAAVAYVAASGDTPATPGKPALWTYDLNVSSPVNGDMITILIPIAGHNNGVFISLDNGTNYKPVSVKDTSRLTTHFAAGHFLTLIYDANGQTNAVYPVAGATATTDVTGGCWRIVNYYDTNTNTLLRTYASATNKDVPLIGQSSANSITAAWSTYTGTYKDWYGVIPNDDTKRVKINLSTGLLKVPGGIEAKSISLTDKIAADDLPTATTAALGIVKIGSNISVSSGTISVPTATSAALGVAKFGTGLAVSSGNVTVSYGNGGTAVSTTASNGSANSAARSDHVHSIALATGDANGQVKIAGTNVAVKGLGSAAYTASTAYATAGHNHDSTYVNVSGDTMTGTLKLASNKYDGTTSGLDASNSDIINVNGIRTVDAADNFNEGYEFYRSSTTWDAMAANGGTFYFGSNVARDAALAGSATISAGHIKSNGTIYVRPASGSYTEGIRIYAYGSWATIVLGGNDLTADTGTSTNSWSIHNNNGNFYISRNGSSSSTAAILKCVSNVWSWNGTATGSISGNAGTATKLATARSINGTNFDGSGNITTANWGTARTLTIGSSGKSVNGSANVSWSLSEIGAAPTSHTHYDTDVKWIQQGTGGAALGVQPVGALFNDVLRANRFAGLNPNGVTILYSTNGGSSWTTYPSLDNNLKRNLFTDGATLRAVPSGTTINASSQLRITIATGAAGVYTVINRLLFYISTGGSNDCKVTVKCALESSPSNYNHTVCENVVINGWSGWNDIGAGGFVTYGNNAGTQYGRIQITFTCGSYSGSAAATAGGLNILNIKAFGGYGWTEPCYLAKYDRPYIIGNDQTVHFDYGVYGAVWNDYAEYRVAECAKPGECVIESATRLMLRSTKRLLPGAHIVSDTFGFAIGLTKIANTPIAVTGRVLAYVASEVTDNDIGAAVCAAPNGKVDIMTREEIREYPERIIGTISEIPNYDIWYAGNGNQPKEIKVDGRIWISIR